MTVQTTFFATIQNLFRRLHSDSLIRNSLFLMVTTVLSSLLGYLYWVIAAHMFQDSEVGLASAVISVMTVTSLLSNIGFGSALVQLLPRRESGRDWASLLNFSLIVSSFTSLIGGLIALVILARSPQFAELTQNNVYLAAFLASIPLWTASTLLDATFTAERTTNHMLWHNLIFSIAKIVLLGVFAVMKIQGIGIFLSWFVATIIGIVASFELLRRLQRGYHITVKGVGVHAKELFNSLFGNHFINLGGALPMYLLPVIVTIRLSATDNAYFYATWMLGSQFSLISVAVAASLFAEGSYTTANIIDKMRRSFIVTAVLLLPVMAASYLLGPRVLGVFGAQYPQHGTPLLMWLTSAAIFDAITSLYVSVLRVQKRLWSAAMLNTVMAVVTLVLSWVLIPSMGITGTGVAQFLAQGTGTLIAVVDYFISRRRITQLEADSAPLTEAVL